MLEDRLLLLRSRRGSREALRLIYEKYERDLLTLAANLLDNCCDAEDVVQDVFVRFVQSLDKFHLTGSLKGYLATCVVNRARDYHRKRKRQPTVELPWADQVASDQASPVQLLTRSEELLRLSQAMTELPYEQREAVVLRLHGNMRFWQIAKSQSVSVRTAISRYRYGLEKLRSIMNGEVTNETGGRIGKAS
jgi:RNA polymerase sigma-70 factor (ECF subfamily)